MARIHDEDAVGEVAGTRDVVRDVEERDTLLLAQLAHEVEDADADRDVEHRDGLVRDDQLRPQCEGLCEPDALPLPAAQLEGKPTARVARRYEPNRLQHAVQLGPALRPGEVPAVKFHPAQDPVRDPVCRVERAVRILEHHRHSGAVGKLALSAAQSAQGLPLEPHLSPGRLVDEREQPRDRALAAPALSHQSDDLAAPDAQVDVVDGMQGLSGDELADPEVAGQALRTEERLRHCAGSRRTQRTRLPLTE